MHSSLFVRPLAIVLTGILCVACHAQEPNPAPVAAATTQPVSAAQAAETVETIVFFRHGEKPADGLGQLTPQGLNRALAISTVLPEKFGRPDALFAPDPDERVKDRGGLFNYVRPLATIEPLAIRLGMPVHTPCGFLAILELNSQLTDEKYASATLFVAWEHIYEQKAVADLIKSFGGDASVVPAWKSEDYDSLYVVKIRRTPDGKATATFSLDHEGLNGQSTTMPAPAGK